MCRFLERVETNEVIGDSFIFASQCFTDISLTCYRSCLISFHRVLSLVPLCGLGPQLLDHVAEVEEEAVDPGQLVGQAVAGQVAQVLVKVGQVAHLCLRGGGQQGHDHQAVGSGQQRRCASGDLVNCALS